MYVQSLDAIPWHTRLLEAFRRSSPWLGNWGNGRVNRESARVEH